MVATIKDLSERTGLSLATISKYLNGGNVLAANRAAIDKAIEELDYRVNTVARGLKTRRSMTIGVLIPDLENNFCTTIIAHLENRLLQSGYSTIICNYQMDAHLERDKFDFLIERQIDGLVYMPNTGNSAGISLLQSRNIPVVLIDRPVRQCNCDVVVINNRQIARQAVSRLIDAGHRRVAIICGPGSIFTARERLEGYFAAHREHNLQIDQKLIRYGDYQAKSGFTLTKKLLSLSPPPTALFVTNNEMTVGSMLALNDLSINIPQTLSVIGFDNYILATVPKPKLSIVLQPLQQIGHTTADILLKRVQEKFNPDVQSATDNRLHELKAVLLPGETIAKQSS